MITPRLESGPFDTVAGLPVHPLVVHAVVVLLPLAAVALIVIVLVPRWRGTFGWITLAGLAVGTGAAFRAKESGEALAARVGLPERHASLGDVLPLVAALLFVAALGWFLLDRRERRSAATSNTLLARILGPVAAVLAVATIGLTIAVGHSGAEAVWAGRLSNVPAATATPPASDTSSYTLDEVAAHSTPSDCWTTIDGKVYDLTDWIGRHPGGAATIESLCGIDGTAAFTGQHGGQPRPMAELASFQIGQLSGPTSS